MPRTKEERYLASLEDWPTAGTGVHIHMLRIAGFGVSAGISREQIKEDIERTMPRPPTPHDEVDVTLDKAFDPTPDLRGRPPAPAGDGTVMFDQFTSGCPVSGDYRRHLRRCSSVKFWDWAVNEVSWRFIDTLYNPDDILYIGDTYGKQVRPAYEWSRALRKGFTSPYIIPNPLTGALALTRGGRSSYRCDAAVADYRYYMLEFDERNLEEQFQFFCAFKEAAPVVALIYSGKKSIHGWVRLEGVTTAEEWHEEVVGAYHRRFIPMGVDRACRNPSRLSRLPGHYREGGGVQQLLYFNPTGEQA